jgi:PadR family transcriptional regulator, regulatory protein AphA
VSSDRLSPFSYVILVLVGQKGAGPHDLKRNARQGRLYWEAAPSQWYAEPKRLASLGLLEARKEPGVTRERTHYTLTAKGRAALEEWMRTPVSFPRIQNEPSVRVLGADLVDPSATLEGLRAYGEVLDELQAMMDSDAPMQERTLSHRADLLRVNRRYAQGMIDLQREWLRDAERVLRHRGAKP